MNEEKLMHYFEEGLNFVKDKALTKVNAIPVYGPIVYLVSSTLLDSMGTFLEGEFDEVYKEKISMYHNFIHGASTLKLNKFYNNYPFLKKEYAEELNDFSNPDSIQVLRSHYPTLYKILVMKDMLLNIAYANEIKEGKWKEIIKDVNRHDLIPSKIQTLLNSKEGVIQKDLDSFLELNDFFKSFYKEASDEFKKDKNVKNKLFSILKNILGGFL